MTLATVVGCALLLLIGGCAGPETGRGAADLVDGAPPASMAPGDVADAVIRPDPILLTGNISPYTVEGKSYQVMNSAAGYVEEGVASWYGTKFHGNLTSNGEVFDVYQPSAAHRTLPIPAYVRVTNLANGRSMVVRVNDRGPFRKGRLIDLSYGAAVRLGFAEQGTAPVRVEALEVAGVRDLRGTDTTEYRYLQVGAFASPEAALELRDALASLVSVPVSVSPVDSAGRRLNRVRVGPVADETELRSVQRILQEQGFGPGQALP